jgi:dephospho-CoA kinase
LALPVVGIVGGIGSGKSAVADVLVRHGGYLIPADQLGHEALRQPAIKARVVARWGDDVVKPTGEIDRRRLGRIVFADPAERAALEALVFPYIDRRIHEEIAAAGRQEGVRFIVLDAAIMLETGWHRVCDKIVFVDSPDEDRYRRLKARSGWTENEVRDREMAQTPLAEKRRRADAVIDNGGPVEALEPQVARLLEQWGYV